MCVSVCVSTGTLDGHDDDDEEEEEVTIIMQMRTYSSLHVCYH